MEEPARGVGDEVDSVRVLEELTEGSEPHRAEHETGAGLASLTRFVDLGRGDALGKREIRLDDERSPQNDDEQHAEDAADEHDERALPVVELRPCAGDHERGDGENRARDQRLSHRGRGARDVLLENRSAEGPEGGHGDDRRGKGRRDGESRLHAQVRVRGAEHHGHQHAQENGFERQLPIHERDLHSPRERSEPRPRPPSASSRRRSREIRWGHERCSRDRGLP